MFMKILIASFGLIIAKVVGSLFKSMHLLRRSFSQFKRKSRGLPMFENYSIVGGGHVETLASGKTWKKMDDALKYKQTLGGMYGSLPMICTRNLDLINDMIFGEPQHVDPVTGLHSSLLYFDDDQIIFANGNRWRRLRKAIAPAFSKQRVQAQNVQREIHSTIDKLISAIERRFDKTCDDHITFDVEDIFHRFAIELVFACLYKQPGLIDFDADVEWWQVILGDRLRHFKNPLTALWIAFPFIRPIAEYIIKNLHPMGPSFRRVREFIKQQAAIHIEARVILQDMQKANKNADLDDVILPDSTKFERNMVDHVIDHLAENKITNNEFLNSTYFLFNAANKTSADAISKLIYYESSDQDIQKKLRDSIILDDVDSEYLSWCIKESLRLFPPAHIGCFRMTLREFLIKDGHIVPEGTFVLTPAYTIHRLKSYWGEDANEFRPERWAEAKNFHPVQYMPFGLGPRKCPGAEFAMSEIKSLMSKLLRRYEFAFVSDSIDDSVTPFLIFCVAIEPTYIRIKKLIWIDLVSHGDWIMDK